LPDAIVDFVRAGVEQVFALEINLRAAEFAGEPFRKIKRRGPAAKFFQVIFELALECRVLLRALVFVLQLLQGMHQRLRHEPPAVRAEMALGVWQFSAGIFTHRPIFTQRRRDAKELFLPKINTDSHG